jgi:hypothetical protein
VQDAILEIVWELLPVEVCLAPFAGRGFRDRKLFVGPMKTASESLKERN